MAKLKPSKVKYISSSEVFDGRPHAKEAFDDAGEFSYGENDLSLVKRDKLLAALKALDIDGDTDVSDEVDKCIEFLEGLDPELYIDLEDM